MINFAYVKRFEISWVLLMLRRIKVCHFCDFNGELDKSPLVPIVYIV